jgi:hypothetical protein
MFGLGSRDVLRVRVCNIKYDCLTVITVKPKPAVRSLIEEIQRKDMAHDDRIHAQMAMQREKRARRTMITRMAIMG